LVSAPGDQDHTISPSAKAALVQRRSHVHRSPPLRIVTTRTPLFDEAGCEELNMVSEKKKVKYFAQRSNCGHAADCTNEINFSGAANLRK
jgi:hypothetical protein